MKNFRFLSFGGGSTMHRLNVRRIAKEANQSGWFSEINCYDDKTLYRQFPNFKHDHLKFVNNNQRGFGLWVWKPFLIMESLKSLPTSCDGLVYMDAGGHLNVNSDSSTHIEKYFTMTKEKEILSFFLPGKIEKDWTKKELFESFPAFRIHAPTEQIMASAIFFSRSELNIHIVEKWFDLCLKDNYKYLKDPDDLDKYNIHRHDQSLLSLVLKSHSIVPIKDETFFEPYWSSLGHDFPIWTSRNISLFFINQSGFLKKIIHQVLSFISRLLN